MKTPSRSLKLNAAAVLALAISLALAGCGGDAPEGEAADQTAEAGDAAEKKEDGKEGGKKDGEKAFSELNERLERLQELLYAEGKRKVLIVLQGMDTSGKDGTIRHIFDGVNPTGVKVASFKKPNSLELAHDYLWRVHHHAPATGEIVVFNTPDAARVKCGAGGTFVKRLIGLPGETVEVRLRRGLGYVFINGKELREPYIQASRRSTEEFGPVKVRNGSYFMMGDNRSQSCDSREWGSVPRGNLIGKVFATYWPPNRLGLH